jgi:hypothetical protein
MSTSKRLREIHAEKHWNPSETWLAGELERTRKRLARSLWALRQEGGRVATACKVPRRFLYVKALVDELDELRTRRDRAEAKTFGGHTCSQTCQRPKCVERRKKPEADK